MLADFHSLPAGSTHKGMSGGGKRKSTDVSSAGTNIVQLLEPSSQEHQWQGKTFYNFSPVEFLGVAEWQLKIPGWG